MLNTPTLTSTTRLYIGPHPFPASFTLKIMMVLYAEPLTELQPMMWLTPKAEITHQMAINICYKLSFLLPVSNMSSNNHRLKRCSNLTFL
jgi:hypothetical protein